MRVNLLVDKEVTQFIQFKSEIPQKMAVPNVGQQNLGASLVFGPELFLDSISTQLLLTRCGLDTW